ncbi:ISNCY family transposase [Cupriavidus necator]|uniref:ISNCY family transposase n=1 Tax=Cupriavidus necator TaxID=106590 RepID=A0A367PBD1_CUPNE|nr:ISNCY family transposase [Cupriavidus necator]QQX88551.1 ISNCY family transposase [Cupriavidus necator]RCJ04843.1 ISNCY family transposase [Cupriavidus necator]
MAGTEVITVSMRELDRLKTVQAVVDGQLRPGVAAERLEITDRQFRRLLERYKQEGPSGLVSRRRGRPSNNRMPADRESVALGLIREHYADFGPTLAAEKLHERHGLTLSKETIRRLMTAAGLWVPRKQRPPKVYQPRNRRACHGELIQIDGSDHRWFEERAPACTLLVYVDDATSRIMELRFTHSESTFTYFAATRAYLERHGKPVAFYSDKASVFRVNKQGATGGDGHTQFARALFELNIEGICANSSQAKGRVERTHLTLQDRLVKELRLRNISTMEAANAFMAEFIADYNARFAKLPRNNHNAHRSLRPDENLDLIFAWREPRCVSKSLTIQYDKMLYLLTDTPEHRKLAGHYIDVYHYPDGRIEPRANGTALPYTIYDKLSEVDQGAIVDNKRLGHVLQLAQYVQEKRDNTRSLSVPGTEGAPRKRGRPPGKKSQRSLDQNDMLESLKRLQQQPWPLNGTES